MVQLDSYREAAKMFYDRLRREVVDLPERRVVFHIFSMNGCGLFVSLWDMLSDDEGGANRLRRSQVHGLIFDR